MLRGKSQYTQHNSSILLRGHLQRKLSLKTLEFLERPDEQVNWRVTVGPQWVSGICNKGGLKVVHAPTERPGGVPLETQNVQEDFNV